MLASVRVRVTHLLLRVLSRARECSLARSAFWHASVSRVSRERLARFVTFLVSGTVNPVSVVHNSLQLRAALATIFGYCKESFSVLCTTRHAKEFHYSDDCSNASRTCNTCISGSGL